MRNETNEAILRDQRIADGVEAENNIHLLRTDPDLVANDKREEQIFASGRHGERNGTTVPARSRAVETAARKKNGPEPIKERRNPKIGDVDPADIGGVSEGTLRMTADPAEILENSPEESNFSRGVGDVFDNQAPGASDPVELDYSESMGNYEDYLGRKNRREGSGNPTITAETSPGIGGTLLKRGMRQRSERKHDYTDTNIRTDNSWKKEPVGGQYERHKPRHKDTLPPDQPTV